MRTQRLIIYSLLFIAVFFILSCNTPPDPKYNKDGTQYGVVQGLFRERWWNFYERGNSFSNGSFWQEAEADFRQALKQRDRDQRRARTYGMHFVDYFPHRDLGIAYYHLGKYEKALQELELSLSQSETGKTKFYINKVRRALLTASGSDTQAPSISVAQAKDISNSFTLDLQGEVADDAYAEKISVNDDPLFVELSAPKLPFSKKIKLKKGLNKIKIKTTDLMGKTSEKTVKVFGDFEGPALQVKNFSDGQKVGRNRIVLNGALADATGITTLKINNQLLAYNKEREVD
ncbi:MAG: hypothetical protein GY868_06355, partial [Deltaproteobacteria bacterium]|nr:hypothetical protein [Deltaproteobacteria bacterium]